MSSLRRESPHMDRISAPSAVPQPEPYTGVDDYLPSFMHRPRGRSPRSGRTARLLDDYDSSGEALYAVPESEEDYYRPRERDRSRGNRRSPMENFPMERERDPRTGSFGSRRVDTAEKSGMAATPIVERDSYRARQRDRDVAAALTAVNRYRERERDRSRERRHERRTGGRRYASSDESGDERHSARKVRAVPRRDPTEAPGAIASQGPLSTAATVVLSHPGLSGQRTHQEPQSPVDPSPQAATKLSDWRPEQTYNPYSVMPVYPALSEPLGDVRDTSAARSLWLQKKAGGMKDSEVMNRIMGLFGLEDFKMHCLSLYEQVVSATASKRLEEAGDLDMFFTGSEGSGQDIAALRYRELLISLEVIPRPSLIHYFSDDPNSIVTAELALKKVLSRDVGDTTESFVFEYRGQREEGARQAFVHVRDQAQQQKKEAKKATQIVWIGIGMSPAEKELSFAEPGVNTIHVPPLTFVDLCHGLCFLLGFGNSLSLRIEGGQNGIIVTKVIDRIVEGHQSRGAWKQWTTLESTAKMLRERRFRPYWTPEGTVSVRALESAGQYYAACHLLGESPDELRARVNEYEQLMQMTALYNLKAEITTLVETERRNQLRRLEGNAPRMSRHERAALHRCFYGHPGTGRRTVAKLYARILWRLGLIEGTETVTLRLASLTKLSHRAIERQINEAFGDPKNIGTVIIEDIGVDGSSRTISDEHSRSKDEDTDDHESDDRYEKATAQQSRYSEHELRAVVFKLLAATIKASNDRNTGPVLIFIAHITMMTPKVGLGLLNPAMSSAFLGLFPESTQRFHFETYTVDELSTIFKRSLARRRGLTGTGKTPLQAPLSPEAETALHEVLSLARLRPSFDNINFVDRLLLEVESNNLYRTHLSRVAQQDEEVEEKEGALRAADFYANMPYSSNKGSGPSAFRNKFIDDLVKDFVGLHQIVQFVKGICLMATNMRKEMRKDPRPFIPYLLLLAGPPGTGKTTVVRNVLAPLYCSIGLLDYRAIVTCHMSELMHPQEQLSLSHRSGRDSNKSIRVSRAAVSKVMDSAYGRVLHIRGHSSKDNATSTSSAVYGDSASHANATRDSILACITELWESDEARWKQKLVIVYEEDDTAVAMPNSTNDNSTAGPNTFNAASLARQVGPFFPLYFPAITDPAMMMQMLQRKVADANIKIQPRPAIGQLHEFNNVEAAALIKSSKRVDAMFSIIAKAPTFSGREIDALARALVMYVHGRTLDIPKSSTGAPATRPTRSIVTLAELAMLLHDLYPGHSWSQNG